MVRLIPPHQLMGDERDAYLDAQWRPSAQFIGPVMPTMIAWQRAGEPGFPFHWDGGPLPGTINYPKVGGQFQFSFGNPKLKRPTSFPAGQSSGRIKEGG